MRGVILFFSLRFRRIAMAAVSVCSALFFGASADQAVGAIVYDNGAADPSGGNESTLWLQANDFTLGSTTNLTGASFFIAGFGGIGNWDGTLEYLLFADSGNSPGTLITNGNGNNIVTTDTFVGWLGGGNIHQVDFEFATPFAAAAGTKYWLGLHLAADYSTMDFIYWVITSPTLANGGGNALESDGGTMNNWLGQGKEHAFYLNGTPAGGAVPEPTSLAIFGLGAVGAAYRARRRLVAG
ncbi:MAG: PEP-CTERM sorting domain-containing protein [Pirellulaceae bacterium]